jgi:hypothetical protein
MRRMGTGRLPSIVGLLALVLGAAGPACGRSSMGALHDSESGVCDGRVERGYMVDANSCASARPRLRDYWSRQGFSCGFDLALSDKPTDACNDLPPMTSRCLLEAAGFPEAFSESQLLVSMEGSPQALTVCRSSWKGSKEADGGEDCAAEAVFVPCEVRKIAE